MKEKKAFIAALKFLASDHSLRRYKMKFVGYQITPVIVFEDRVVAVDSFQKVGDIADGQKVQLMYGVYGRDKSGMAFHICDRVRQEDAIKLLNQITWLDIKSPGPGPFEVTV